MYSKTAFDSRKHQFSTYEKTDFKPPFMSLSRKKKFDRNFLNELVKDYSFTSSLNDLDCLRQFDIQDLKLHRYHYGFQLCGHSGGINFFIYLISIIILLFGFISFFIRPDNMPNLTQTNVIIIICTILLFKLNLYYQSSLDPYLLTLSTKPDDTRFDRYTGMLLIKKGNETTKIPFNELDAYYTHGTTGTSNISTNIIFLAHRHSNDAYGLSSSSHMKVMLGKLSYIIRFMDISKPLPNMPLLAIDRNQDPKTASVSDESVLTSEQWLAINNDTWTNQIITAEDKLNEIYGDR